MITITILIGIILILSYLLFREHNKPQLNITTQDVQNVAKYNLITKVFLDILSQSQQLNTKVEILTGDNESLKQEIKKLEKQINTLYEEYQIRLELNNKLEIQNTILTQRNQDLETNQKSFIQKLGGIVYKENLEDKTWDLVLNKVQVLMNERNEAVIKIQSITQDIEFFKQENVLLVKEKSMFDQSLQVLKSIITTKENEINSLIPKLRTLEFKYEELLKDLQSITDHSIELEKIKNELKNLQDVIINKDDLIQSLEIEKGENLQKISLLETSFISEKSNCESLTQENMNLNIRVKQLEDEIEVLNNKPVDSNIERLESQIAQKDNAIKKLEVEKNQNIQKIEQLKIKLTEKELELKTAIEDSNNRIQELEKERDSLTGDFRDVERKLRDVEWELSVLKGSNISVLTEELRKQIDQKDAVIKKLEFEKKQNTKRLDLLESSIKEKDDMIRKLALKPVDNSLNISLNCNITRQESQITIIEQENTYLIPPIEVLEKSPKELEYSLKDLEQYTDDLEQYADDLEQYAEDLEQYYLEKLETYSDTPNINKLEELQKQIYEKDTCIRQLNVKLENCSNLINITEVEDIKKQIDKKNAYILNLKLSHDAEIDIDLNIISSLENSLYEEQRKVKHFRGVIRKLKKYIR